MPHSEVTLCQSCTSNEVVVIFFIRFFFFFLQTDSYKNHSETSPVINPGGLRCGPRGRKGQALKTPSIIIGINLSS